jgi:competence protein ComEC
MNKKLLITVLSMCIIFILNGCYSKGEYENNSYIINENLTIDVFDVGKADCILINAKGKYIMIDTGLDKDKNEISKKLKSKGINELEYLILTHMDKDHIGGADKIINEFKINNLIQPDYKKDSNQYKEYEKVIGENNIIPNLLHSEIDTKIDDIELKMYPAEKKEYKESNDYSIIVDITCKDQSFLFMGDAEEERIEEFIKFNNKHYTAIKMPHHGKCNNMTEKLIENTRPKYSIITCSEDENADDETIDILKKYNVKNYLTKNGDVTIKSDGKNTSLFQ